jgi:hypothetical protein
MLGVMVSRSQQKLVVEMREAMVAGQGRIGDGAGMERYSQ